MFVAGDTLPSGLRRVAMGTRSTARSRLGASSFGTPSLARPVAPASAEHPALVSLGWIAVILAVFLPLAVDRFRRAARR